MNYRTLHEGGTGLGFSESETKEWCGNCMTWYFQLVEARKQKRQLFWLGGVSMFLGICIGRWL